MQTETLCIHSFFRRPNGSFQCAHCRTSLPFASIESKPVVVARPDHQTSVTAIVERAVGRWNTDTYKTSN